MKYKVTALRDVTVRAFVPTQTPVRIGTQTVMKPSEQEEWISLRAGEVRDGVGLVLGVHPASLPNEIATHVQGVPMILTAGWSNADLPKEFFGLYRLECQE